MYIERDYRKFSSSLGLVAFEVKIKESDLYILASRDLSENAIAALRKVRSEINAAITMFPDFGKSEEPLDIKELGGVARWMLEAAKAAGVGPMAAVAGAVAQYVGRALLPVSENVIVENGGDIFMATTEEITVGIFAGPSPLSGKIGMKMPPRPEGMGVCTSSGTVGHSKSYGIADAVVAISAEASLADAVATAAGNLVKTPKDLSTAVDFGRSIGGIEGIVAVCGSDIAAWGDVELVSTS